MAKFVVDFDEDAGVFYTKHNGYKISHSRIGSLVGQLRKIYQEIGKPFPGYKATRKAQKQY